MREKTAKCVSEGNAYAALRASLHTFQLEEYRLSEGERIGAGLPIVPERETRLHSDLTLVGVACETKLDWILGPVGGPPEEFYEQAAETAIARLMIDFI